MVCAIYARSCAIVQAESFVNAESIKAMTLYTSRQEFV